MGLSNQRLGLPATAPCIGRDGEWVTMSTDDIEDWVTRTAHDGAAEAKLALFRRFRSSEVFFASTTRFVGGELMDAAPLLRLPDGTHAMMLYTSGAHPDVPTDYSGASIETALGLALKMPDADWVILTNLVSEWVALNRQQMATILDEAVGGSGSRDRLSSLISEAAATSPQQFTDAMLAELAERELYVELAPGESPEGRPMLSTFTVGPTTGVVRAYLTRRRQGVRYGGMQWEALRDLVIATPALAGAQVVNDADDWVLFDRPALDPAVTYYATLRDGGSPDDPTGILRRVHTEPPVDEAFGRDMQWHQTDFLRRHQALGTSDVDHVEISRDAAAAILDRWRSQWTAQP